MSKILISYRREDSIDVTGRIYDRLVKDFAPDAVFMDVDSIPYGVDFRTYLDEQVSQCEVFLAVIGRDWLRGKERKGRSRLEDPGDFVRIEIESALKRRIPVIPVLVGGASVPPAQQLPASIQDLPYRHAVVIRPNPDFHRDMDRLVDYPRTQLAGKKEQLAHPKVQGMARDVSGTEKSDQSEVVRSGKEAVEVNARPSGQDSEVQGMEPEKEERVASSAMSQTPTDGFPTYMLGGIGLVVLIGALAAFLILQPNPSPVYSPPVAEKEDERQAQVIPLQPSPPSAGPVVVLNKQERPVEKQVITNGPQKVTEKKEERTVRKIPPSPSRPAEPVAAPRKHPVPTEKQDTANKPPKFAEKQEAPTVNESQPVSPSPSVPVEVPQKQETPVEKRVTARDPLIPSPQMIRISPGSFMMGGSGDKDEAPIHEVRFTKPFAMARYETTFDEYDRYAQATGRELPEDEGWGRGRRPVINVKWENANAYAQWLSEQTGKRYRLPTEAEWEYAARSGGKDETWAGTSDASLLEDYAVYGERGTKPVGSKKPNGLGLFDMSGNVWEWVQDCQHRNYERTLANGSAWLEANGGDCGQRVLRGGSWSNFPVNLRASYRSWNLTVSRSIFIGFRLVEDIP